MINSNGILAANAGTIEANRGFLFGDGVFETVKIVDNKVLFLEDHYFRLMSGMRIVRMRIPMDFTMEHFEQQLLATAAASDCAGSARVRITVYRDASGRYLPDSNNVSYVISASALPFAAYTIADVTYEVELYKDFYITRQLLSTVKSTNRIINVIGSIFGEENGLQNCLLLNDAKNIVEALNGNIFMVSGSRIVTPPLSEGCLNGVLRKQIIEMLKKNSDFEFEETVISPFDLQKADELFITNVISGIQPITKYRKKEYSTTIARQLCTALNLKVRELVQ